MKVNNCTVLHIFGRDTKFAASAFSDGDTATPEWEIFLIKWVATYIEHPDKSCLTKENSFKAVNLRLFL